MRLAGIGLHTGCKGVRGCFYHCFIGCIDLCVEKREVRFWGEAGTGYLSSGSSEVKVWGMVEQVLFGGLLWLDGNT